MRASPCARWLHAYASAGHPRTPVCLFCQMSAQIVRASETMRVCAGGEPAPALQLRNVLSRIMKVCGRREQASSCAAFVNSASCLAHAESASTSLELSCCDVQAVYVRACESVLVCPCLSCVEMPRTGVRTGCARAWRRVTRVRYAG